MMIREQQENVRYLRDVQGLSFRQIARRTGWSRYKVSGLYSGDFHNYRARGSSLDPFRDLILSWLKETPSLKALQIWKRLKERGVQTSYRLTVKYTRAFRKKKKDKVYWPLTFLPAEEGQVDWFFLTHPKLGKLAGFTLILSYSRYAFADLQGCPHALRYDNLKSVVLSREPLTYNPSFLEFARHYGFTIRVCNPAAGNEKGRVERLIRSIRATFVNTADHHQSLSALNQALHAWIREKNHTLHRATQAIPDEKKREEPLRRLPDQPWNNVVIHPPKRPTKTGLLIFDTNRYSVPEYITQDMLSISAFVDRIEIFDRKGNRVACHPRSFQRNQQIINPLHRSGKQLSDSGKRQRIFTVIQQMDPVVAVFLEQNQQAGEDPYHTAYALFKLLRQHSRGLILSLIRQAHAQHVYQLRFLLSHLDPQELPADPVSPQNPSLLTLDYQSRSLEEYDVSR